jgi:hypothetical protein
MATLSAAASPFCRPEEDPFLLLESSLKAIERILQLRRGLPLRRTWIEQPYGEEEITILEEEVIPVIQQCLARIDELDERLLAQQELLQRCQLQMACCPGPAGSPHPGIQVVTANPRKASATQLRC